MNTHIEIWHSKEAREAFYNWNGTGVLPPYAIYAHTFDNFNWITSKMSKVSDKRKSIIISISELCWITAEAHREMEKENCKDRKNLKMFTDDMWDIFFKGTKGVIPHDAICVLYNCK